MPGDPAGASGPNEDPGHPQRFEATASGSARIYQAGREQHIAERDLHLHYADGTVGARRVVFDDEVGAHDCPYPGLPAFEGEQAQWFFGRDRLTAELLSRLDERLRGGGALAVVAPSGAGKTSALKAGLLPALARGALPVPGSARWPRLLLTPTADPVRMLTTRLADALVLDPRQVAGPGAAVSRSWATAARAALGAAVDGQGQRLRDHRLVIVVDQLEELFTACESEPDRHAFLDLLSSLALADPRGGPPAALVVFGLRSDFYTSCARYPQLRAVLSHGQVLVAPLTEAELRQAILFPARSVGLDIEPGLVELLLRDLGIPTFRTDTNGLSLADEHDLPLAENSSTLPTENYESGRLPLLAHALRVTWQQRHGHTLTVDGYRTTGGIHQAVATTAERLFTALEPAAQQAARTVFLRLVKLGDGLDDTRRPLPHDQLQAIGKDPAATAAVIESFARGRLLTRRRDSVEITHEALLHAWPRLRRWIDTDRAGHLAHQQLEEAAADWFKAHHDTGLLYRGHRLEAVRAWADGPRRESLSATAARFLTTSTQHQRRATRLRRTLITVVTALALIASFAAVVALQQRATARDQRDDAIFKRITAEADNVRFPEAALAAQLDLVAHRMRPDAAVRLHLISDANGPLATPVTEHEGVVRTVAYGPGGRLLASGGGDGTVRLWDVTRPTRPKALGTPLKCGAETVTTVALSAKGHLLACGAYGGRGTVRLWDVADPARPTALGGPLASLKSAAMTAAFSPDGRTLAVVSGDRKLRLWQVGPTGAAQPPAEQLATYPGYFPSALAYSPDGNTLATGDTNGEIRLWDVVGQPTALGTPVNAADLGSVLSAAFSPDGDTLATGGSDGTIRLLDVSNRDRPKALAKRLTGHTGAVRSVAFNTAGDTLASGSEDCAVRLWDVDQPEYPAPGGRPLNSHTAPVNAVAFHPDGQRLASGADDRAIMLWTLPTALPDNDTGAFTLAFSPRSPFLVAGTALGVASVWTLKDPFRPRLLTTNTAKPSPTEVETGPAIALSPDGRILAGGSKLTVGLWNATDLPRLTPLGKPLTGHTATLQAVRFSPDGHTLASLDRRGTLRLWDVTDPRHARPLSSPLPGQPETNNALAFSPDGRTLATASRLHHIRLWDVTDPARPRYGQVLKGHTDMVSSLAFTSDGQTLVSGGHDGKARLWDVANPDSPKALGKPLTGHAGDVLTVAVSNDAHLLATGGRDTAVQLWDIADRAHPTYVDRSLTGHRDPVSALAFSPDGRSLASGSLEGSVWLWHLNAQDNKRHICNTTRAALTRAAWQQHLTGLAFTPPCT
ncbi:WD40 repeat domain-containing protein [Streptomyces phaeochromogenes]|uniref:NACHT and WD repeat domain-containing protein n=1 Tax=Streptomyces phaeochromogenes TaxID=1923 RepID=UPI00386C83CA|nr:WD40 repeat domain-containing protein [Streptomyces phaeochromogenes]WSS99662.1 WD40 repeat domain-containing protein [Streptomyces phaeochromogenes]